MQKNPSYPGYIIAECSATFYTCQTLDPLHLPALQTVFLVLWLVQVNYSAVENGYKSYFFQETHCRLLAAAVHQETALVNVPVPRITCSTAESLHPSLHDQLWRLLVSISYRAGRI